MQKICLKRKNGTKEGIFAKQKQIEQSSILFNAQSQISCLSVFFFLLEERTKRMS